MMLGLALMAGDQGVDEPSALTMDAAALEHLAVDKTDLQDYPSWSKTVDDINAAPALSHGLWAYYKGPPFLQRVTMYSGNDIDLTKSGELVRRIIGLPKNYGKWEGNHYLANFDSQQMYFLQSNQHSVLIFPPMKEKHLPILSVHATDMIHRYVSIGHNTLILTGGPGAVKFINDYLFTDGMTILETAWTRGPYEKQEATVGTPFQPLTATLPNMENHVHGVRKGSLPLEAVSYYEVPTEQGDDIISVVFSIDYEEGMVMYIGYDYTDISMPWMKTLIAAMEFAD